MFPETECCDQAAHLLKTSFALDLAFGKDQWYLSYKEPSPQMNMALNRNRSAPRPAPIVRPDNIYTRGMTQGMRWRHERLKHSGCFFTPAPVTNSHISQLFRLFLCLFSRGSKHCFPQCPAGPITGQHLYNQTLLPSSVPQFLHLEKKKKKAIITRYFKQCWDDNSGLCKDDYSKWTTR